MTRPKLERLTQANVANRTCCPLAKIRNFLLKLDEECVFTLLLRRSIRFLGLTRNDHSHIGNFFGRAVSV